MGSKSSGRCPHRSLRLPFSPLSLSLFLSSPSPVPTDIQQVALVGWIESKYPNCAVALPAYAAGADPFFLLQPFQTENSFEFQRQLIEQLCVPTSNLNILHWPVKYLTMMQLSPKT